MRNTMQLTKRLLTAVLPLLFLVTVNGNASDAQYAPLEFATGDFNQDVNPGLYPPLSSGEASPWQDESQKQVPDLTGKGNPWGASPVVPVEPKAYGVPAMPVNPYYGYGVQQRASPYYYPPQQGYGYAPPAYGYAPTYPAVPYGNYGPFNGTPFGGMPFNGMPFNNGGYNPFGFSMPMPF